VRGVGYQSFGFRGKEPAEFQERFSRVALAVLVKQRDSNPSADSTITLMVIAPES